MNFTNSSAVITNWLTWFLSATSGVWFWFSSSIRRFMTSSQNGLIRRFSSEYERITSAWIMLLYYYFLSNKTGLCMILRSDRNVRRNNKYQNNKDIIVWSKYKNWGKEGQDFAKQWTSVKRFESILTSNSCFKTTATDKLTEMSK